MKQIIAIVRPNLAEQVLDSVRGVPIEAVIVREVKGYGRQKSYLKDYGDSEYGLAYLPKVEITWWVDNDQADEVVKRVTDIAKTGRMGDGKVIVMPVLGTEIAM